MTEDELDKETLLALASMIDEGGENITTAHLFRRLWKERRIYRKAVWDIATWNLIHSDALGEARAIEIAEQAFVDADDEIGL